MKRAAAISLTALLSVGGAGTILMSTAGAQTVSSTTSTTSTSIAPTPPTTEVPGVVVTDFSVTLAGLGDITLSVDPVTRTISNIVVTPIDGITVADPTAVHHGVQLDFTLSDGTVRSIVIEVEGRRGQVRLEIEDETEDELDDDHSEGPPAIEDRGESAAHRNDDSGHRGRGSTPTTVPATTRTTPTTLGSHSSDSASSHSGSDDDDGSSDVRSGRSGRSGSDD